MAETIIHVRLTAEEVRQILRTIPERARGQAGQAILTRAGMALLGRIKQAFIVKSQGGTDESGLRWAPLSPKTVAYGRRGQTGRTRTEKKRSTQPSQALTKKQQDRWWELYRQGLAIYKGDKRSAAKRAWFIIKGQGAQTLVGKYGNRRVEILRDTGLLLNSLSPGSANAHTVFRLGNGSVTMGTNRKGAIAHHHGVPGRLPQRRLWPEPRNFPATWNRDVMEQVQQGLVQLIAQALKQ